MQHYHYQKVSYQWQLSNYALLVGEKACHDNKRPHRFEFKMDGAASNRHVSMVYYRWCHQKKSWADVPIPMFNYVPELANLKPANLRGNFVKQVQNCNGACPKILNCPKCAIFVGLNAIKETIDPSVFHKWGDRFNSMSQAVAEKSLPESMTLPMPNPPQVPDFQLPDVCKIPETSQLPPPIEHSQYVLESRGKFTIAGLQNLLKELKAKGKVDKGASDEAPDIDINDGSLHHIEQVTQPAKLN